MRLTLEALEGEFSICRLPHDSPVPAWAIAGAAWSITRTDAELSVVCPSGLVPPGTAAAAGWRALRVAGRLDFALTGILTSLADPLTRAGVSLFAMSTYDTDYVLVRAAQWPDAVASLRAAGHTVQGVIPSGRT